jgi:hypothetical protein
VVRCEATTIGGSQCRNDAIPASTRCYIHADPEERGKLTVDLGHPALGLYLIQS